MPLALLSNWKMILGSGIALIALIAIGIQTARLAYAQHEIAGYQTTVGMLTESIAEMHAAALRQNAAIADYKNKSDAAQKAAKAALQASAAAHAGDASRISDLLSRAHLPTSEAACNAADEVILEFAR